MACEACALVLAQVLPGTHLEGVPAFSYPPPRPQFPPLRGWQTDDRHTGCCHAAPLSPAPTQPSGAPTDTKAPAHCSDAPREGKRGVPGRSPIPQGPRERAPEGGGAGCRWAGPGPHLHRVHDSLGLLSCRAVASGGGRGQLRHRAGWALREGMAQLSSFSQVAAALSKGPDSTGPGPRQGEWGEGGEESGVRAGPGQGRGAAPGAVCPAGSSLNTRKSVNPSTMRRRTKVTCKRRAPDSQAPSHPRRPVGDSAQSAPRTRSLFQA